MADRVLEPVDDQSPIQRTIEIHRHRIASIIDRMLEKIEIAYCLDELFADDGAHIAQYLTSRDLKHVMDLHAKMSRSSTGISATGKNSKASKIKKSPSIDFKHGHHDLVCSKLIAILHHSKDVLKSVQAMIAKKSSAQLQFLTHMRALQACIVQELHTTASQERAFNKEIGKSWLNNEKYLRKNTEMDVMHSNTVFELSFKVKEKLDIINKYKNQMKTTREKGVNDLHKIINDSERNLLKTATASAENQEFLSEEAKATISQYQNLLETHLAHEKALRIKRGKVEAVLAGWLAKYDADIGELQAQLEEEEDGYNKEKAAFDLLTDNFAKQTIEYDQLMEEKEIEEQRLFDIKLFEFMKLRSARRIQRWWRAILARKKARRKGKKGKGKKK